MQHPERIGRYRIVGHLGSGAFASVWLAHDDLLDTPVAVKVLAENWNSVADTRQRFVQEARLLRRADSDRVVRVHDIGDLDDGRPYFVMTYADQGTLQHRLNGLFDAAEALRLTVETALGVAVLHEQNVVHRDVKPSNVLLHRGASATERVLIGDLGLARDADLPSNMTLSAGTPVFMAPEQVTGTGITLAADVYALGALGYRLLTGEPPRAGANPVAVLAGTAEPMVAPSTLRPELPPEVDAVILRALAVRPEERYPTAAEFGAALSTAAAPLTGAASSGATTVAPVVAAQPEPTPDDPALPNGKTTSDDGLRTPLLLAGVLGVVLVALVVLAAVLMPERDSPSAPSSPPAATEPVASSVSMKPPPATTPAPAQPPVVRPAPVTTTTRPPATTTTTEPPTTTSSVPPPTTTEPPVTTTVSGP